MSNKLDFSVLDSAKGSARPWKSRDTNPTVQMSVRMEEDVYERFRQHCRIDRRTNGEMLEIMMAAYEREMKAGSAPQGAKDPAKSRSE